MARRTRAAAASVQGDSMSTLATDDNGTDEVVSNEDAIANDGADFSSRLKARDFAFLNRVLRFLLIVQNPTFSRRARREGYTDAEHRTGLELWQQASGITRSIDDHFAHEQRESSDMRGEELRILQEIDDFENKWFPRTRAIIRRVVPTDRRETFEQAFFADLSQQPLGPQVVGSVTALLARVEGLETSGQPEAKAVRSTLAARGLTAGKIKAIRALMAELGDLKTPELVVDPEALRKADEAQQEGLEQLHAWFNDWAITLRSVLSAREQRRLGLTVPHASGGGSTGDDDASDGEGDGGTPAGEGTAGSGSDTGRSSGSGG